MPAWGDAAGGANDAFFAVLKQREVERQHALEAELMRMRIENARQEMGLREREMGLAERQHTSREGAALADQLPPRAFLAEDDPAVETIQKSGRGSLLTKQDPTLGSRSMAGYQSLPGAPVEAATRVEETPSRPKGFLKTRSQKQIDTDTDNERQQLQAMLLAEHQRRQDERNVQRDDDTASYREGMLGVAERNAAANEMRAQREPQGRESFDEWKRKHDYEVANPKRKDEAKPVEDKQDEIQATIDLIDAIGKDPSTRNFSGPVDNYIGKFRDLGGVTRVENRHNELIGKLSLAQAGKLKGQGQISNYERQLLQNAATALNRNLKDEDYKAELLKIRAQFERMKGASGTSSPGSSRAAELIRKYGG